MVYLIVSPKNPLKDSISSDSARDRFNAAVSAVHRHFASKSEVAECVDDMPPPARGCLTEGKTGVVGTSATSDFPKVIVDDIELTMPQPHYTIRTLDALREREPQNSFTFVMGADSLADIRRWKDYTRILKEFGVAVFPRIGHNLEAIRTDLLKEDQTYKITILKAEMVDISSTTIREAIASGKDISNLLM